MRSNDNQLCLFDDTTIAAVDAEQQRKTEKQRLDYLRDQNELALWVDILSDKYHDEKYCHAAIFVYPDR